PNVRPFFFHAYNPAWEVPLDFGAKEYGMVYVGNNWFRWRGMKRVLEAIKPVREQVGRIGLVGHGWTTVPPWASPTLIEDAYCTNASYLEEMDIEINPPVQFSEVIEVMGRGIFSPVIYRPLFDHLRLVTCRTFETPAANTIPLFAQDPQYVEEIYGEEALELVLPEKKPEEKILDLLRRRERYERIVIRLRRHLAEKYSYVLRLKELLKIVKE
ncbi:MAG TPA: glycosyltransferase, partial [Candidatus Binatia bacterium]|nr:glycosyltransferase [Candidatus Binatia bacterium]